MWLLSGAAFMSVIATAGCAGGPGRPSESALLRSMDGAAPDRAPARPVLDASGPESNAPKVNIFGEFDGVEHGEFGNGVQANFQQHTYVDEGYDGDVAVDPKGQWLVFSSTRHSEHSNLYLQKVDGLSVTELTSDNADDAFPTFSPDGRKIAFCSTRSGNWDIYVMDTDGRNAVQVTNSPAQEMHPSFSPDGTRLVYCTLGNRSGQWELWTVHLTTGEKRMIGLGLFPTWSPAKDKDQIAFQKARGRGSRWFSLWTMDLVDGESRCVTEIAVSSNAAIVSPAWSPDGKRLSFATIVEPNKADGAKSHGQQDIWTVNADGGNRQRVTDGNGVCSTPFWAANNRIFFISDRGGTECIWSALADHGMVSTSTAGVETREVGN